MVEENLKEALARIIAPLVESDEGELYFVEEKGRVIRLHLGGRFAGCPGNELVREQVLQPLIETIRPGTDLVVTSGALLPPGAERIATAIE